MHMLRKQQMKIREATKKGYVEANDGDYVSIAYPNSETRRGRLGAGVANSLLTENSGGVIDGEKIRKLTPKEYWRLFDFDDADYEKAKAIQSDTQLYKQAGNSIVVNVLVAILGQLFEGKEDVYKQR